MANQTLINLKSIYNIENDGTILEILRNIRNSCTNVYDAMIKILTDDDSIAYNILLSKGEDIEAIYLNIINTNY